MLVAYFTLRALAQRRPAQQRLQRRANPSRVRSLQIHSQHALLYLAVEGWRGEIIHWIRTGPDNHLERCKINDPSLNNWPALVEAVQGNIIADFPVINKSFNLSYSGTDR